MFPIQRTKVQFFGSFLNLYLKVTDIQTATDFPWKHSWWWRPQAYRMETPRTFPY